EAKLVILDEPTSSLDAGIAEQLLAHIREFCSGGGAVIFITHMLGEIFAVASRIIVMKDGLIVADRGAGQFTRQGLVDDMGHVATETAQSEADKAHTLGEEVVKTPEGISARRGEIVGLSGLAGHGQAEALARLYLGATSSWRRPRSPSIVFVAGDRTRDGIMPLWSILRNATLSILSETSRHGMVNQT